MFCPFSSPARTGKMGNIARAAENFAAPGRGWGSFSLFRPVWKRDAFLEKARSAAPGKKPFVPSFLPSFAPILKNM